MSLLQSPQGVVVDTNLIAQYYEGTLRGYLKRRVRKWLDADPELKEAIDEAMELNEGGFNEQPC